MVTLGLGTVEGGTGGIHKSAPKPQCGARHFNLFKARLRILFKVGINHRFRHTVCGTREVCVTRAEVMQQDIDELKLSHCSSECNSNHP